MASTGAAQVGQHRWQSLLMSTSHSNSVLLVTSSQGRRSELEHFASLPDMAIPTMADFILSM